jgi:hypothetical protein
VHEHLHEQSGPGVALVRRRTVASCRDAGWLLDVRGGGRAGHQQDHPGICWKVRFHSRSDTAVITASDHD